MSSSEDDDAYGPPLPPGFKSKPGDKGKGHYGSSFPPHLVQSSERKSTYSIQSSGHHDSRDDDLYGSTAPPRLDRNPSGKRDHSDSEEDYVPALPPGMQRLDLKRRSGPSKTHQSKFTKRDSEESEDDDDMYGPALPPHLVKGRSTQISLPIGQKIKGPTLPPGFVLPESFSSYHEVEEEEVDEESDDEEDEGPLVGPVPSAVAFDEAEYRAQQFELRAKKMKDRLEGKSDVSKAVKRETWMLELPEDKPNFCGLTPRQFRKKAPQERGDRSVWTDTPEDKERKAMMELEGDDRREEEVIDLAKQERDDDLTARVDQYNKEKRAKPLIDLHKKKMKEKAESSGPKERRPFSREEDMNVNKFDDAQKTNILKKARQLNDRFNPGDRKFL